ncbi:redox-sensing transcriptional repressor Rex [Heliorestis acidaminivorans]|uniref:Redox-sensing transcriptional repressor Rex n=1 Tax=Heliorestis acidaminivorans TaxID=553427 RepID=A0A6I0EZH0_9FIRM|nr:redox-sensing transcriptional repressor Rex [Heliorestis acidaminivorans]KAB2950989.1 redox-sensing transcriptional repressor Rex [Heliorestis acidaminivorans]
MKVLKIPEPTVVRLSLYSRFLNQANDRGMDIISSDEIGVAVGIPSAQVRKDLSYFGEFGIRGVGYRVKDLCEQVDKLLCVNQSWPVIIIGAGHLGKALATYKGLLDRGFDVVALFDSHPNELEHEKDSGTDTLPENLPIYPLDMLNKVVQEKQVKMGIIAVPADSAQSIADDLVQSGVASIINFAPVVLNVPDHIEVRNIDLTVNLEVLSFNLGMRS